MSLKEALSKLFPDSSRSKLKNWLEMGRFSIDGKRAEKENQILDEGMVLSAIDRFVAPKVPGLTLLYEDRHLVVIDKPSGLLSVPLDDEKNSHRHALGLLKKHLHTDQIFAVHRIDREASGVLIFAKGKESEERLKKLFELHDLKRQYLAIVEGKLLENEGTWKEKLLELPNYDVVVSPEGKEAITHFKVIRRSPKYSFLQVTLETGRKHQIRVHCQRKGFPILGDFRYGALENPLGRLALHAELLELVHPFTKKPLSFKSPIPRAFRMLGVGLKH